MSTANIGRGTRRRYLRGTKLGNHFRRDVGRWRRLLRAGIERGSSDFGSTLTSRADGFRQVMPGAFQFVERRLVIRAFVRRARPRPSIARWQLVGRKSPCGVCSACAFSIAVFPLLLAAAVFVLVLGRGEFEIPVENMAVVVVMHEIRRRPACRFACRNQRRLCRQHQRRSRLRLLDKRLRRRHGCSDFGADRTEPVTSARATRCCNWESPRDCASAWVSARPPATPASPLRSSASVFSMSVCALAIFAESSARRLASASCGCAA